MSATTLQRLGFVLGNGWIVFLFRLALGVIFLVAAVPKILDPTAFAPQVRDYDILPLSLIPIFAVTLPWIEAVAGVFLILGFRARASAATISFLLFVFTMAVVSAVARGLEIDCGCFSREGGEGVGLMTILRDLGMLAMGLAIYFGDHRFVSLDRLFARKLRHA